MYSGFTAIKNNTFCLKKGEVFMVNSIINKAVKEKKNDNILLLH